MRGKQASEQLESIRSMGEPHAASSAYQNGHRVSLISLNGARQPSLGQATKESRPGKDVTPVSPSLRALKGRDNRTSLHHVMLSWNSGSRRRHKPRDLHRKQRCPALSGLRSIWDGLIPLQRILFLRRHLDDDAAGRGGSDLLHFLGRLGSDHGERKTLPASVLLSPHLCFNDRCEMGMKCLEKKIYKLRVVISDCGRFCPHHFAVSG